PFHTTGVAIVGGMRVGYSFQKIAFFPCLLRPEHHKRPHHRVFLKKTVVVFDGLACRDGVFNWERSC
ncbi:MAG: hypothetical protein QGH12_02630, partial [SAR324 cluster bacterium]|nr:hypothetical protein [SAR324 cluster bacterium]